MDAQKIAHAWIAAWNSRNLDEILSHYAEEIEFTSPLAARIVPESGGIVRGISALRAYWTQGLAANPHLHFTLVEVFETVSGVTLLYRNHRQQLVTESLFFNAQGLVVRSSAAYAKLPEPTGP
jgi:hypothetical protein